MERRKVLANYGREVKGRTRNINLLHAMFVHQGAYDDSKEKSRYG